MDQRDISAFARLCFTAPCCNQGRPTQMIFEENENEKRESIKWAHLPPPPLFSGQMEQLGNLSEYAPDKPA